MFNTKNNTPIISEQLILEEKGQKEEINKLQEQLNIACDKLRGTVCWESWETREGIENFIEELKKEIELKKQLDEKNTQDKDDSIWEMIYPKQIKKQNINTDPRLSQWIFELLKEKITSGLIVDIGSGDGSLLAPWKQAGYNTFGIDLVENSSAEVKINFFKVDKWSDICSQSPSLVLSNPSFPPYHTLLPWLGKIIELFGKDQSIVLFSKPNQRIGNSLDSEVYQKWLSGKFPEIKSIASLYLKMRDDKINYNCELWFFGINGLKPHYFFQPPKLNEIG